MKILYSVNYVTSCRSDSIYTSENLTDAQTFYKTEVAKQGKPVNTRGWPDRNTAWGDVYHIELEKLEIDDDDEIFAFETLAFSPYFWLD